MAEMRPIAAVMMIFGAMLLPTVLSAPLAQPGTPNTNSTATLASPTDHCQQEEIRGFQVLNCGPIPVRGIFSLEATLYKTPSIEHCNLTEVNGYLHYICGYTTDPWTQTIMPLFKCPYSNYLYHVLTGYAGNECDFGVQFSFLCPDDPGFYQACGHRPAHCSSRYKELDDNSLLCGTYLCEEESMIFDVIASTERQVACEEGACYNTDLNMVGCNEEDHHEEYFPLSTLCNNVCDDWDCEDESDCNGVQYGMYCEGRGWRSEKYAPPAYMCDGFSNCDYGEDEDRECFYLEEGDRTCTTNRRGRGLEIKLIQEMRCFPEFEDVSLCVNGEDQSNCTDPEKISMQCLSNGYPTSISIFGYCKDYQLCDDDYNNACVEPVHGCKIHKAQLCDGKKDCRFGTDEGQHQCDDGLMTYFFRCQRRFSLEGSQRPFLSLPLAWAMDGVIDCLNGEDEDEGWWVKCGNGSDSRFYEIGTDCSEVTVPETVRGCADQGVETNIIDTSIKFDDEHYLPGCYGADLDTPLGDCRKREHTASLVKTVMDIHPPIWINLPGKKIDCSYLYGENYVYAACNGLCLDAACPLLPAAGDTCNNKLYTRVFALADKSPPALVTLLKKAKDPGEYENQLFPCDNKNCVLYKDVCNLRDDCGDGSDEKNCNNLCPVDSIV